MSKPYDYYNEPPMKRTLDEIKKMSLLNKKSQQNYGCINQPLLNIPLDHVILDELHKLLLRITDILLDNVIEDAIEMDEDQVWFKKRVNHRGCDIFYLGKKQC
jgi:hypothetical protein